ncbi:hypothetical protein SAMN05444166_6859 [Singulisphaera sp. GP187]|uniref:hypothetical protein n=1 Tax=Singulisphaera sp. GP187 TaxID=1882752 RepID=UPI000928DCB7|nr:hypothetical protein [Singulisphaera sp. GP187]SIO61796.1 hypothetical protein SAMN05444166_6859 [Singulisphaera sp. GP187]
MQPTDPPRHERVAKRRWVHPVGNLLLVIVAVAVLATLVRSKTTFEADRVEWRPVSMPDGQSSLWMPVNPKVSQRSVADGPGTFETTELKWVSSNGATVFGCIQNVIPAHVSLARENEILSTISQQAASAAKTRIIAQEPIRLAKKWNGREVRVESDQGSYGVLRYYIIKHRIYQLQAIVPKSRNKSRLIDRFLNSFGYASEASESTPPI